MPSCQHSVWLCGCEAFKGLEPVDGYLLDSLVPLHFPSPSIFASSFSFSFSFGFFFSLDSFDSFLFLRLLLLARFFVFIPFPTFIRRFFPFSSSCYSRPKGNERAWTRVSFFFKEGSLSLQLFRLLFRGFCCLTPNEKSHMKKEGKEKPKENKEKIIPFI